MGLNIEAKTMDSPKLPHSVSVSLPRELLTAIELARGDVPRSRFISKIVAVHLQGRGDSA